MDFKIDKTMSIYEVSKLREKLIDALGSEDTIDMDLSEVDDCDTAGIQLLCSAMITARKKGKTIRLMGMSEAVEAAASNIGIDLERIGAAEG